MANGENKVLGTVGALVGSLLGLGVFLLLGRIGVISVLGGAVACACIFGGYYLLAKDISPVGLVICGVLLIATVYFANKLDWSIELSKALKEYCMTASVGECYKVLGGFLELADLKGKYIRDLVLSYVFTVLGGFYALKAAKK